MASKDCLEWLRYANMDIKAAQNLFDKQQNPRHRPIEIILFHCQQCAEKALKSYIVENGVLEKALHTHDLQILRQACEQWNSKFSKPRIIGQCAFLDPFSVTTRYPKHRLPLDSALAARGINCAKRIYNFTCEQLKLEKSYMIDNQ